MTRNMGMKFNLNFSISFHYRCYCCCCSDFFSPFEISFGADVILLTFDLILSIVGTFQSIDVDLHGFALDSTNPIELLAPYR